MPMIDVYATGGTLWPSSARGQPLVSQIAEAAFESDDVGGHVLPRVVGSGDVWVIESTISYDGVPHHLASIWEFRDGKVVHETSYITEGWDPPAWRAEWVEPIPDDANFGQAAS